MLARPFMLVPDFMTTTPPAHKSSCELLYKMCARFRKEEGLAAIKKLCILSAAIAVVLSVAVVQEKPAVQVGFTSPGRLMPVTPL
jgi:hypothetical protein